jgi:two-component system chemotaxis response regulator CheB
LLGGLPADFSAPVLICQHMPATFTGPFARRLDQVSPLHVVEVTGPTPLAAGTAYLGRGDADLVLMRRGGTLMATSVPADGRPWHPSIGRLVETALAQMPAAQLVGVMLTGMGDDGAVEMTRLLDSGGRTVAQDEESSVVFGMPAALIAAGGAETVLPLARIATRLGVWLQRGLARREA